MTFTFYNRYIPSTESSTPSQQSDRPLKKRKTDNGHDNSNHKNHHDVETEAELVTPQSENTNPTAKERDATDPLKSFKKSKYKDKKKSNKGHAVLPSTDANTEEPVNVPKKADRRARKHEAVLSRFSASVKPGKDDIRIDDAGDEPDGSKEQIVEHHGLEPLPQPELSQTVSKLSLSDILPEWIRTPTIVPSERTPFSSLPLSKDTVKALKQAGYTDTLPIQSAIISRLLGSASHTHDDLCIQAPTGSGKTLAYALPTFEYFRNCTGKLLTAVIIVPTRELVDQAKEMLNACIGSSKGIKVATACGNRQFKEEQIALVRTYQRYDPEAYEAEQIVEVDRDEKLFDNFDWDTGCQINSYDDDERMFNHVYDYQSNATILISTPGRLVEHVRSTKGFTLDYVEWLVIDEVDRILDENFQGWLDVVMPEIERPPKPSTSNKILENTFPLPLKRQTRKIILSASMTKDVGKLAGLKLRTPQLLVLKDPRDENEAGLDGGDQGQSYTLPSGLRENAVSLTDVDTKPLELIRVMESAPQILKDGQEEAAQPSDEDGSPSSNPDRLISRSHPPSNPTGSHPLKIRATLVFTKSTEATHRLFRLLTILRPQYSSQIATFSKSSATKKTLKRFAKQKISILIATDRASRGLDIPHLEHVINYDMPSSQESYVHRVGRTARAGGVGLATTLVAHHQARWFWNEIAKGSTITRQGKRIERWHLGELKMSEEESKNYQNAITKLGEEVRGK